MKKLLTGLCLVLLCSCSVTQTMKLSPSTGGSDIISIESTPFFEAVLEDLSPVSGDNPLTSAMENLSLNLQYSGAFDVNQDDKTLSFSFSSLESLLQNLAGRDLDNLLTVVDHEDQRTMTFNLDIDNYRILEEAIPFLSEPNFQVYGPVYNSYLEPSEYLEMMDFIFGPEASENIKGSIIRLSFILPGTITKCDGIVTDANSFEFTIPLIDFLMLKESISFSCTWSLPN